MVTARSILSAFLLITLHSNLYAQLKPDTAQHKIPDSLSLALKDTDGDGVNNAEDKCINEKGPASNYGCPIIISDPCPQDILFTRNIFFKTGKLQFSPRSISVLSKLVNILNENPRYKVQLIKYSDDVGNNDQNRNLYAKRVEALKVQLISSGIDKSRIEYQSETSEYSKDSIPGTRDYNGIEIRIYHQCSN